MGAVGIVWMAELPWPMGQPESQLGASWGYG